MKAEYKLRDVLQEIGFKQNAEGLQFDFGNCLLTALEGINMRLQEGFNFNGIYKTERRSGIIDFYLPLEVETFEQGIAFLAYYLRNADLEKKPAWLKEGLKMKELLPWEKEMVEHEQRPKVFIERDWFKVLVNKLRSQLEEVSENDLTEFYCNGRDLEVKCNEMTFIVGGQGNKWPEKVKIRTKDLEGLPKRIRTESILLGVWRGYLTIGRIMFKIQ